MQKYQNLSGKSSIESYELGNNRIIVQYKNGSAFLFNQSYSGTLDLNIMKDLAQTGKGLSTFIQRFVGNGYWSQLN